MAAPDRSAARNARLFFALWPDDAVRASLYQTAQVMQADTGGRLIKPDKLHQTLVFLGDVAAERMPGVVALGSALQGLAFTLEFGVTGYWRHNRIVWAAPRVTPPSLLTLVAALERALRLQGFRLDERPYASHVTLIRDARAPAALPPLSFSWPVRTFALIESAAGARGVEYRIRESWALPACTQQENSD